MQETESLEQICLPFRQRWCQRPKCVVQYTLPTYVQARIVSVSQLVLCSQKHKTIALNFAEQVYKYSYQMAAMLDHAQNEVQQ